MFKALFLYKAISNSCDKELQKTQFKVKTLSLCSDMS